MKKSLIFAGMLAVGYANAQYEGKVGVNTETPKATLEVQPSTANLTGTTNEGLLIPRLSKERVAKMASPETSTLVYVNEATTYTTGTDTAADARVAKIDAVGFYHYNGTQWVKHLDTDTNDSEWVYDATTNRINLKRSGSGTFANSVYYDANTGQKISTTSQNILNESYRINGTSTLETATKSLSEITKAKDINYSLASELSTLTDGSNTYKGLEYNRMHVDSGSTATQHRLAENYLYVNSDNTNDYSVIYSGISRSFLLGQGNVTSSLGHWGQVDVSNTQSVSGLVGGALGHAGMYSQGTVDNLYGLMGRAYFGSNNGIVNRAASLYTTSLHWSVTDKTLVKEYAGIYNELPVNSQNQQEGTSVTGIRNRITMQGKTKYPDVYGIYTATTITPTAVAPTNNYGLYIADVKGGETLNRAIHTGTGKIRFGDLADASATADRVVTVDKDGVLKTGEAVTNTVKIATTSAVTCDATTTGTMNFGTVNINGKDTEAFGFCMKNSAGEYKWYYIYGGAGITTGSGTFGTGL